MNFRNRPAAAGLTPLRAALDEVFAAAPELLAPELLKLQGELLNANSSRLLLVEDGAVRSADGGEPPDADDMTLVRQAARDGAIHQGQGGGEAVRLAAPIGRSGATMVVALHRLAQATPLTIAFAQERLELTGALARALLGRDASRGSSMVAEALVQAAAAPNGAAARQIALALTSETGASRIVAGFIRNFRIVEAADTAAPDKLPASAVAPIALALGEVADMPTPVRGPLAGLAGFDALAGGAECIGLARLSGKDGLAVIAWGAADLQQLTSLMQPAAAIAIARQNRLRLSDRFDALAARLPWPESVAPESRPRLARRLALALVAALLLFPLPASVSAPLSIEPLVKRVVTAPLSSRIDRVEVEPGDHVKAGDLLLVLDTHALERERDEAGATLQAAAVEQSRARDEGDSDSARLAELRMAQVQANLAAIEGRIAEGEVRASMDGTIGGADMKQRLGATVSRGEELFTVSAGTGKRAELMVPDRDIGRVEVGDSVSLALSAQPFTRPGARVSRIYPVAEVTRSGNAFRVIATLDDDASELRPGMEGTGRIRTGWRPLAWQLVEPAVRWIRLKTWL